MSFNYDIDNKSPFSPGKPVLPEDLVGRRNTIQKIFNHVSRARHSDPQHFYLTGNQGMGKTSIAKFVEEYIEHETNMKTIYYSNKHNDSVEILLTHLFERILDKFPKDSIKDKVRKWLGDNVKSIELKGNKVVFNPSESLKRDLIYNFPYLDHLCKEFTDNNGFFIIIDDINGLSKNKKFANWYKQFADTLEVDMDYNIPLYMLLVSYPEKFNSLIKHDSTFGRIFHHDHIEKLGDDEIKTFFIDSFKKVDMECNSDALDVMIYFSNGLPLVMQQIGDSIFWLNNNKNYLITEEEAEEGIIKAADEIGSKILKPILDEFDNKLFEEILKKISSTKTLKFKKSQIKPFLNVEEKEVLNIFLDKMIDLNILKLKNKEYSFTNQLYYTYFLIKSIQ